MSNTKISVVNQLSLQQNPAVTIAHNDLSETAPFLATNLLDVDRYAWWKSASMAIGTYVIDFNMGGTPTIGVAGAHCFTLLAGLAPSITVYTQTGSYSFGGTWTSRGTLPNPGAKDDWIEFGPISSIHSIRFEFGVTSNPTQFRLGKFWAGVTTDLLGVYSRGGKRTKFQNRADLTLPSGVPMITDLGDPGAIFSFPWNAAPAAVTTAMRDAQTRRTPILLLDETPAVYETILSEGKLAESLVAGTTYDLEWELQRLP
jgi:hypothetical protein